MPRASSDVQSVVVIGSTQCWPGVRVVSLIHDLLLNTYVTADCCTEALKLLAHRGTSL